jgi:UDP:flavonoid glycosyltransferase YjiC (YdhE family)
VSPAFVPPDPLWQGRVVQTGYWFLDMPHFEPDPELAAFLAAGEPPLVISFGSMVNADPRRTTALLCEAVERVGCRALIQAGWAGLGEGPLPPNVRRIDFVPHDWLFPRASGVIHHGGAGTTAAVLRAGVPQAVVWHLGDQPAWGKLLHKRGLAPAAPLWQGALNVDWLTRVMRALRSDPGLRGQAATVGARIRQEEGVRQAVTALEASLPTATS